MVKTPSLPDKQAGPLLLVPAISVGILRAAAAAEQCHQAQQEQQVSCGHIHSCQLEFYPDAAHQRVDVFRGKQVPVQSIESVGDIELRAPVRDILNEGQP